MLVVRTYDISDSDFVDTGIYLNGYALTTESYADWLEQLSLLPLGESNTLSSLPDGMVPDKYNVPGYIVNNNWEEGHLLKEEVYKKMGTNMSYVVVRKTFTQDIYVTLGFPLASIQKEFCFLVLIQFVLLIGVTFQCHRYSISTSSI